MRSLALAAGLALTAHCARGENTWFTPRVGKHGPAEVVRRINGSTLYALHADGYSDPILVANISAPTRHGLGFAYGCGAAGRPAAPTPPDPRRCPTQVHAQRGDQGEHAGPLLFSAAQPAAAGPHVRLPQLRVRPAHPASRACAPLSGRRDGPSRAVCVCGLTRPPLQLPEEYAEEMRGLEDGAAAAGHPDATRFAKFGITLANAATGDVEHDIEYILVNQVRGGWRRGGLVPRHRPSTCAPSTGSPVGRRAPHTVLRLPQRRGSRPPLRSGQRPRRHPAQRARAGVHGQSPRPLPAHVLHGRRLGLSHAGGATVLHAQPRLARAVRCGPPPPAPGLAACLTPSPAARRLPGISKHKLVTIMHPPEEGRHPHAAIAFAGLYGALAGA